MPNLSNTSATIPKPTVEARPNCSQAFARRDRKRKQLLPFPAQPPVLADHCVHPAVSAAHGPAGQDHLERGQPWCQAAVRRPAIQLQQTGQASDEHHWSTYSANQAKAVPTHRRGKSQYNNHKTCVPSMIHSARPTVPPVAIAIFTWKFVLRYFKSGDGRTDWRIDSTCENSDHYRPRRWVGLVDQYRKDERLGKNPTSHIAFSVRAIASSDVMASL